MLSHSLKQQASTKFRRNLDETASVCRASAERERERDSAANEPNLIGVASSSLEAIAISIDNWQSKQFVPINKILI